MKGRICLSLFWVHGGPNKSLHPIKSIDDFFGPVTSLSSRPTPFIGTSVADFQAFYSYVFLTAWSATVDFFDAHFTRGGWLRIIRFLRIPCNLPIRRIVQCHFVTEYIMTITNHFRRIHDLADLAIHFVDAKNYPKAHLALDDIEKKVRESHRHIDHLQNVTDFCARPAGEDT